MDPGLASFAKILDPQVSARGAKYALIEHDKKVGDGKLRIMIGDKTQPTFSPFGMSTYNNDDSQRKNIEFVLTPTDEDKVNRVYDWALGYLASQSDRFFKKPVAKDELLELFKHPVVKKEQYAPKLKCKIDTIGKNAVRCWDPQGQRCELPSDLRGYKLVPKITFNHIWFMSKECGIVCLCSDLLILECATEECPFE